MIERRVVSAAIGKAPLFDERRENAHEQILVEPEFAR